MTHQDAFEVVFRLVLLCGLFTPLVIFRDTSKRKTITKKATTRRRKAKARPTGKNLSVSNRESTRNRKEAKPRPLSFEDQNRVDRWRMGRDFPNFKSMSNIPL